MRTEVSPSLSITPAFASAVIVNRPWPAGAPASAGARGAGTSCATGAARDTAAMRNASAAPPRTRDRAGPLIEEPAEKLGGALRSEEAQQAGERVEETV